MSRRDTFYDESKPGQPVEGGLLAAILTKGEDPDDLRKGDWWKYVPRDDKGQWITVGVGLGATTQQQHIDAAKYHHARMQYESDKGNTGAAALHAKAKEAHEKAAHKLWSDPMAAAGFSPDATALSLAAQKATEEAQGAKKPKAPPKPKEPSIGQTANSSKEHKAAIAYHAEQATKADAKGYEALAEAHRAAGQAHHDAIQARHAAPSGVETEAEKQASAKAREASKLADSMKGKKAAAPELQFQPVGPRMSEPLKSDADNFHALREVIRGRPAGGWQYSEIEESKFAIKGPNVKASHEYRQSLDKTSQEIKSWGSYKGSGYDPINGLLRDRHDKYFSFEDTKWEADGMTKLVGNAPVLTLGEVTGVAAETQDGDIVVWRNIKGKYLKNLKLGDRWVDKGFASTTADFNFAKDWRTTDTLVRVRLPKGTRGFSVDSESEILLQRDAHFEVTAIARGKGVNIVELRYLGSKPRALKKPGVTT